MPIYEYRCADCRKKTTMDRAAVSMAEPGRIFEGLSMALRVIMAAGSMR